MSCAPIFSTMTPMKQPNEVICNNLHQKNVYTFVERTTQSFEGTQMENRECANIPIELVQTRPSLILKFKEIAPVLFLNSVEAFIKIKKSMTNSNGFEPSHLYTTTR